MREGDPALLQPFIDAARGSWWPRAPRRSPRAAASWCASRRAAGRAAGAGVDLEPAASCRELRRAGRDHGRRRVAGRGHLRAAGADADTPVEGLAPGCALQRTLLERPADARRRRAPRPTRSPPRCAWCARYPAGRRDGARMHQPAALRRWPCARATGRPVHHIVERCCTSAVEALEKHPHELIRALAVLDRPRRHLHRRRRPRARRRAAHAQAAVREPRAVPRRRGRGHPPPAAAWRPARRSRRRRSSA